MDFTTFVRKPFTVEAVEITTENIAEIAEHVGTLRFEDGHPYIEVNRHKVPNVVKVHPGYFMTTLNKQVRCYSGHVFKKEFTELTPGLERIVNQFDGKPEDVFPEEGRIQPVEDHA